jgi:serine/threonine protein kinase
MSSPHRNPVEELAEEFLQRYRRGERPSLTEYIGRRPELAGEIRELFPALVMMEEAGPKSEESVGRAGNVSDRSGRTPERLGDYRILRQVGRGGMGIVYEAEQESLGRHVALKVLPFQSSTNSIYLQRFRREARSAARLHHTNIVPVFDVGEFQGTHFYAMQFIQGQGLDEVLVELAQLRGAENKRPARTPQKAASRSDVDLTARVARGLLTVAHTGQGDESSRLSNEAQGEVGARSVHGGDPDAPTSASPVSDSGSESVPNRPGPSCVGSQSPGHRSDFSTLSDFHFYRSVAHVGLQVADALAYAHGQKVLHRDIKPANVLLDIQGTAWVTDFGLAKEEGDDLTHTGDLVGTLRYMAPERFSGVSDARSDVYSLGLTLYELLTLKPAFEESDRGRLIKQVTHDEPPRPRKRDPRIPRDLETVVLKAIAKEPRLRYASADDMAEDLRRFLADRPIRARRSSVLEHGWRWCRRNRLVASLSAAVLMLVLLLGVGLPVAWLLRGERDRALAAEDEARNLLVRAQEAEGAARAAEREYEIHTHLAQAAA